MSELKTFLDNMARATKGTQQGGFYSRQALDAKDVKVSSVKDVLSEKQIKYIKKYIRPKKHECYKVATEVAIYLGCEYCEGFMQYVIGIEHAFNKVGDKYIDVVGELVLKNDVANTEYVVLGEYTAEEAWHVALQHNTYGDVYRTKIAKELYNVDI